MCSVERALKDFDRSKIYDNQVYLLSDEIKGFDINATASGRRRLGSNTDGYNHGCLFRSVSHA